MRVRSRRIKIHGKARFHSPCVRGTVTEQAASNARSAGSAPRRAGDRVDSIRGARRVVVEREGGGIGSRDEHAEVEATPGVDSRQGARNRHGLRRVARASGAGAGRSGRWVDRDAPPPIGRLSTGPIQPVEIAGPGQRGVPLRRDVLGTPGPRAGRRKPSAAREQETCYKPTMSAPSLWDERLHLDQLRGPRRL